MSCQNLKPERAAPAALPLKIISSAHTTTHASMQMRFLMLYDMPGLARYYQPPALPAETGGMGQYVVSRRENSLFMGLGSGEAIESSSPERMSKENILRASAESAS